MKCCTYTFSIAFFWLIVFTSRLLSAQVLAQSTVSDNSDTSEPFDLRNGTVLRASVIEGDTVAQVNLPLMRVYENRTFKNKREEKNYGRLKRDVLKAYPYAKLAGERLRAYNDTLEALESNYKRDKYLKKVEEELKKEFGKDLMSLTVNQGRILIRLVDRETGDTSYELVKELRGTFSAFFWQTAARLFGHNLKTRYDKNGEDKMIEEIILLIENGDLK